MKINTNTPFDATALVSKTWDFNRISGASQEVHIEALRAQFDYLYEEVRELEDALMDYDMVEVADATADILVVALGMLQKLQAAGFDIQGIVDRVADNNLSKYPSLTKSEVVDATIEMYKAKSIEVEVTSNIPYHCYVFRNKATGKILKPYGFESVDISSCVPEEFQVE